MGMTASTWESLLPPLLALSIPLSFLFSIAFTSVRRPFRWAIVAAYLGLGLALLTAAAGIVAADAGADAVPARLDATGASVARLVHFDVVTRTMLLLVCFIAVVIVRYSRTYLQGQGDARQARYARALLATLAAVTILVLSNHLHVIALAWMGASLALHRLLTFFHDRPQALVAAHKKFLLSRLADVAMLVAVVLVARSVGSLDLDAMAAWARANPSLPIAMQLATLSLVLAVSLKSAQLPFHGWLIQVMEAPTPVSALLHAGVVNIGGFVMIRLAPFMAHAPLAQTLLVVIGTITSVVAALVMTTRGTIKVALAWSTCAQMGFMLVECGLGAWHLALLHLVAHSLYKAHAFLSAGTVVSTWRGLAMARPKAPVALSRIAFASVLSLGSVAASVAAAHALLGTSAPSPTLMPLAVVLGLSLTPLVVRATDDGARSLLGVVLRGVFVGALYFGGHAVAGRLLRAPEPQTMPVTWLVVLVGFQILFVVQMTLEHRPDGALAHALQPRLFAGLYLDEVFTRLTFRLWPLRREPGAVPPSPRVAETLEIP